MEYHCRSAAPTTFSFHSNILWLYRCDPLILFNILVGLRLSSQMIFKVCLVSDLLISPKQDYNVIILTCTGLYMSYHATKVSSNYSESLHVLVTTSLTISTVNPFLLRLSSSNRPNFLSGNSSSNFYVWKQFKRTSHPPFYRLSDSLHDTWILFVYIQWITPRKLLNSLNDLLFSSENLISIQLFFLNYKQLQVDITTSPQMVAETVDSYRKELFHDL